MSGPSGDGGWMNARLVLAGAAVTAWALDLGTKTWAATSLDDRTIAVFGGRLLLRESRNPGAAFSVGTGQTVLISLFALAVVIAVALHAPRVTAPWAGLGWGLIGGGAAGNLTDRLFRTPGPLRGHVVDWLDLGWFPSFNAADSAITVGAVLLVLLSLREGRKPVAQAS